MQLKSKFERKEEQKRILIAEDDPTTRYLLQRTLEGGGYEVIAVKDGRMALECLYGKNGPRLALLDWLMPGIDGLRVCREIRRHSELPYIYIILLTSRQSKLDIVSGLEAGADDYLTKPCDLLELKARLRTGERILKLEDKLTYDALHDPLTRLPNRAFLLERLALCVSWGMRRQNYRFAVLTVDIDRFKIVNDSLGNPAGDWLLIQIAERLVASIRREDAVTRTAAAGRAANLQDKSVLARFDGDKFTILLDDMVSASDGIRVAERIQQNIQAPFFLNSHRLFITASIGIAFSGTGYSAAEDMLGDSKTAVCRAKAVGPGRYEMCDPSMHVHAANRLRLESDLRHAAARNELRLHYQPIVSLDDCRIIGFEALLRWQRPGFGLVLPGEFIPAAEDTGIILEMGTWVLIEACRQMSDWKRQFSSTLAFTMGVNISAKQFAQPSLVQQLREILRDSELSPQTLILEITESVAMGDGARTIQIFRELKDLGVRLCIDDFGTGYSSLSYLRRFGLDILKIDRSFISEMLTNREDQEIVKTIVNLGRNLAMEVVAEGVETSAHVSVLQTLGCTYAQGYLFSRPIDSAAASQILLASEADRYTLPPKSRNAVLCLP
jgi:predicted signal transduction protein with EAL and GGDEF domain